MMDEVTAALAERDRQLRHEVNAAEALDDAYEHAAAINDADLRHATAAVVSALAALAQVASR